MAILRATAGFVLVKGEIEIQRKSGFFACFLIGLSALLITAAGCPDTGVVGTISGKQPKDIKKFRSEEDFKEYLIKGQGKAESNMAAPLLSEATEDLFAREGASRTGRVSQTNVQVLGIDEPDIVKTNGKEIYFSRQPLAGLFPGPQPRVPGLMIPEEEEEPRVAPDEEGSAETEGSAPAGDTAAMTTDPAVTAVTARPEDEKPDTVGAEPPGVTLEESGSLRSIMPPTKTVSNTAIIKAFPVSDLETIANVDKSGELFLEDDSLVVFSGQEITGYDVADPKAPKEEWTNVLDDSSSVVDSRLFKGKIYLVTQSAVDTSDPCPISPMKAEDKEVSIDCEDIYHPDVTVPVDATYSVLVLDPKSGGVDEKVSFVGFSATSNVYVSPQAVYVTYSYAESLIKFFAGFLEENDDLFPADVGETVEQLDGYDISDSSKLFELGTVLQRHFDSLSPEERSQFEQKFQERGAEYFEEHQRDFEKTGIVKIGLPELNIAASGKVPGFLLNQFSLDEYQDHLRVATTIGQSSGLGLGMSMGFGMQGESANDVYVLDEDLKVVGEVKDLGKQERIFSVRFIEDKGYMVTFRQIDPFFVLDLSNPKKPEVKGELKIPGFSSYLHPLAEDKILGTGQEEGQVKISLFDVSSPDKPVERDKYLLSEGWSDVLSNFHAFMLDRKHKVFFIPGGGDGYIFSYQDDKLELKKKVEGARARRAIYIEDFLYVIGEDAVVVFDENNWEIENELRL